MFKWAEKPDTVKYVFDHIRNYLLAVAVLYASAWTAAHAGSSVVGKLGGYGAGALLFFGGAILAVGNASDGMARWFPDPKQQTLPKRAAWGIVVFLYLLLAFEFMDASLSSKLPAVPHAEISNG